MVIDKPLTILQLNTLGILHEATRLEQKEFNGNTLKALVKKELVRRISNSKGQFVAITAKGKKVFKTSGG